MSSSNAKSFTKAKTSRKLNRTEKGPKEVTLKTRKMVLFNIKYQKTKKNLRKFSRSLRNSLSPENPKGPLCYSQKALFLLKFKGPFDCNKFRKKLALSKNRKDGTFFLLPLEALKNFWFSAGLEPTSMKTKIHLVRKSS